MTDSNHPEDCSSLNHRSPDSFPHGGDTDAQSSISSENLSTSASVPAPSSPPSHRGLIFVVGIALVITLIVGVGLGFLIGRSSSVLSSAKTAQSQSYSAENKKKASTQSSAHESSRTQHGSPEKQRAQSDPTFSPSVTDPQVLKTLHSQIRRDPQDPQAIGKVDAPVVMVEFSDYSCPVCASYAVTVEPQLQQLIDDGTLRIEYRDLAFFTDYGSSLAAAGGKAAAYQKQYTAFRHETFGSATTQGHQKYTEESILAIAKKIGIPDFQRFKDDLNSDTTTKAIRTDTQEAQQLGINSIPTFIINDTAFSGIRSAEFMQKTIENQAQKAQR